MKHGGSFARGLGWWGLSMFGAALVVACGGAPPEAAAPREVTKAAPSTAPSERPRTRRQHAAAPTDGPRLAPGARCEDFRLASCPAGCATRCVGSCPTCDDCDGPGSCATPTAPEPTPEPTPTPKLAPGKRCEDFAFGYCPEGCGQQCIGSCPMCADCGGPGSCYTL